MYDQILLQNIKFPELTFSTLQNIKALWCKTKGEFEGLQSQLLNDLMQLGEQTHLTYIHSSAS